MRKKSEIESMYVKIFEEADKGEEGELDDALASGALMAIDWILEWNRPTDLFEDLKR